MSRAASFFRIAFTVLRSRLFRAFLGVVAAIWAFDKFIFGITQRSFFASVGLESWFWRELGARVGLFAVFFGICLGLTLLFLGALTREPLAEFPPLRGVLSQFQTLRKRISRVSWALAILFALLLARDFAGHSFDWIFLRSGARSDFKSLGLSAALWTHFLPVFEPFLRDLWKFSLALGALLLATGLLRALPLLASHNAAPPQLSRVLWRFSGFLWALRAALYLVQVLDLNRGRVLSSGDLWILAPLFALGALACLALCAAFLRRAKQTVWVLPRAKSSKLLLGALGALFLPAISGVLSAPVRAFLPETRFLKREREAATRAAWHLNEPEEIAAETPGSAPIPLAPTEQFWPVWDEKTLLASRAGAVFRGSRIVTWKSATLGSQNGAWNAILAGENAGDSALTSPRGADSSTSLALEYLDLRDGKWVAGAPRAARPAFFGLEGRSLFGKDDFGISLSSFGLKWAWAWRLRDVLLPLDAQNSPRLLTFRGARERAQILAPFLRSAGAPRLIFEGENLVWALDLCAATRNFPGAPSLFSGEFESDLTGANAVSSPLQMRMDARSGAVRFVAARESKIGGRDALRDSWRAAFPEIELANSDSPRANFSGAGSEILRAQAAISALESSEEMQIYGPQIRFDPRDGVVSSVSSAGKSSFEVWQSAPAGSFVSRGQGDLQARLERLDALVAQSAASEKEAPVYRAGEPLVWRDARAPGGFWIARGFFATPRGATESAANISQVAGHGPFLWRVAVAGVAPDARVGVGNSARAAFLSATGQNPPVLTPSFTLESAGAPDAISKAPLNLKAPQKTPFLPAESSAPLEIQALRTHEALQSAAKRGDWKSFGVLDARETAILESLAARRQNEARRPNSTPHQTTIPGP